MNSDKERMVKTLANCPSSKGVESFAQAPQGLRSALQTVCEGSGPRSQPDTVPTDLSISTSDFPFVMAHSDGDSASCGFSFRNF